MPGEDRQQAEGAFVEDEERHLLHRQQGEDPPIGVDQRHAHLQRAVRTLLAALQQFLAHADQFAALQAGEYQQVVGVQRRHLAERRQGLRLRGAVVAHPVESGDAQRTVLGQQRQHGFRQRIERSLLARQLAQQLSQTEQRTA